MRNFQGTFERRKRPLVSAFLICMTVPLNINPFFLLVHQCQRKAWQNENLVEETVFFMN